MPPLFFRRPRGRLKTKTSYSKAIIMLNIIFILTFGRLQASGTLDFPDKLYPIWKWAVGAGVLYAVIMTLISYVFYSFFSPFSLLLTAAVSSAWFALYFKLLRTTTDKPTQHRSIYWGVGIASAFLLPFALGFLNALVPLPQ